MFPLYRKGNASRKHFLMNQKIMNKMQGKAKNDKSHSHLRKEEKNMNEQKKNEKPFGMRDKIGYMFGDLGNDFTFTFASSYLMVFYTNVLGISAAVVGILFLVARFIDAFTDIGMGILIDRVTPGTNGKFKPWIRRMCGFVAIAAFLMYQSGMAEAPTWMKTVYMFVTYILWGSFAYTSINIPYGSMASAISANPADRAELSTWRSLGANFAGVAIGTIVPQVIYREVNGQEVASGTMFTVVAAVFSVLAIICYLLCYQLTTERVKIEKSPGQKAPSVMESVRTLVKSRALLALIAAAIVLLLSTMLGQSMNQYLYIQWFNNKNALSVVGILSLPIVLMIAAAVGMITERFGKKEAGAVGMLVSGTIYILLGIMKIRNPWVYLVLVFFGMLGMYYFNMVIWSYIIDVIDDMEVKNGHREDGTVYGVYSFARKIGQALAGGISGFALAAIGFVEGAETQTENVKEGIYNLANFVPGILYLVVAFLLIFAYPLSRKKVNENSRILEERRRSRG